jgi:hypothetical protein
MALREVIRRPLSTLCGLLSVFVDVSQKATRFVRVRFRPEGV